MKSKAIILFSGGLDSSTTLALAKSKGLECHALTFAYGQRHEVETRHARRAAKVLGAASHRIVPVPFPSEGSALTSRKKKIPKNRALSRMAGEIPITYVPARNTVFLAL
ncbi:MAG: 7-cyano-7-deazaguanine synthase, partial [Bdellovibrionota bacterium]